MNNRVDNPYTQAESSQGNSLVEMATDMRNQLVVKAGLKVCEIRKKYAGSKNPLKHVANGMVLNPLNDWFKGAIPEILKKNESSQNNS